MNLVAQNLLSVSSLIVGIAGVAVAVHAHRKNVRSRINRRERRDHRRLALDQIRMPAWAENRESPASLRRRNRAWITLAVVVCLPLAAPALDTARVETRVDEAIARLGVSGEGVIVAIIDRGANWTNNDFRNPDGTTRFAYLFDLNDDSGANAAGNTYGAGTIYTRAQIDAALASGGALAYRDAIGHGDTTTGIAAGNGRNNPKYRGIAAEATLISIKITGGAAAHDNQPAEPEFYRGDRLMLAMQFVRDKARELGLPAVMLPNVGSQTGPTDGTSLLTRTIDELTGPGTQGLIFVNGTGDMGGAPNRAGGTVAEGQTVELRIRKVDASPLNFELWYRPRDRFEVSFQTPNASHGPFPAPESQADFRSEISYFHYAEDTNLPHFPPLGTHRHVLIVLTGPAGDNAVRLRGTKIVDGRFDATLNPSPYAPNADRNRFLTFAVPGNIWDGATSQYGIVPTASINKVNFVTETGAGLLDASEGGPGAIWTGSSTGPTFDGRFGVDVAAPGQQLAAAYTATSLWGSTPGSRIADGGGVPIQAANATCRKDDGLEKISSGILNPSTSRGRLLRFSLAAVTLENIRARKLRLPF